MAGLATVAGGIKQGVSVLSQAERVIAQNALNRLNTSKGSLGLNMNSQAPSATVFGGVKSARLGSPALTQGLGSDTFTSGARTMSTHALAQIGNDTVLSGSVAASYHAPETRTAHNTFNLNTDTISVKGTTAEAMSGAHVDTKATSSHTITFSDKTTVTVVGLSHHDITKLPH